jgi:2-methylcitrate dehydratase PrpD
MDSILDQLSDYATELNYDELSADMVHEVTRRVVDTFGCAMGI